MIDLRSDTVTKPVPGMLDAMFSAAVGDDVFAEDPTIRSLEKKIASYFGKESAVFCPSGTMTNQIALRVLGKPFEEVICYEGSHIYKYEGGGPAGNSGLSVKLLKGDRGRISMDELESAVNPDDPHFPKSTIISLENTVNKGGGSYYRIPEMREIRSFAEDKGLYTHLDGARVFNALVETGEDAREYGQLFDTISVCLSKGLGAPVGSVLICNADREKEVRRARKIFGGGMRQAGYLAAAGIYALDHHVDRLREDHNRARILGSHLLDLDWICNLLPIDTNIIIVELEEGYAVEYVLEKLQANGILAVAFGSRQIRFVTHLDYQDKQLEETLRLLKKIRL